MEILYSIIYFKIEKATAQSLSFLKPNNIHLENLENWLYDLTFTPILLMLAPIIGLTINTVISKAPKTKPKCQTSNPLLTASLGKNGA